MGDFSIVVTGLKSSGKTRFLHSLLHRVEEETFQSTMEISKIVHPLSGFGNITWIDTPSVTTLFSGFENEITVQKFLLNKQYDAICHIIDVRQFHRSIALFHQLTVLEKPMLVVIFNDEQDQGKERLDLEAIQRDLGAFLLQASADQKQLEVQFTDILAKGLTVPACSLTVSRLEQQRVTTLDVEWTTGRLVLACIEMLATPNLPPPVVEIARDFAKNNPFLRNDLYFTDLSFQIASRQIQSWQRNETPSKDVLTWPQRIGLWAQQPLTGIPIVLSLLGLMYLFVGILGAQIFVDGIETWLFKPVLQPFFSWFASLFPGDFIRNALLDDDFGMIPTGLFLVLGIVFPVLLTYYVFIGLLENAGYFPRLSVLLDRSMRHMGLNGKGVMPLVMGFSCVTMALMTTRMLDTKKERIIASLLLVLGMPCAPLLSTMFIILGQLPFAATLILFGLLFFQIFIGGFVASRLLPGVHSELIMDIPPISMPDVRWVLQSAWVRTLAFMKEATPLFLGASLLLFGLNEAGLVRWLEETASPIVTDFWGLPSNAVQVFIKTLIRRENGVAELARLQSGFTGNQLLITLLLMTFLMPCINATLMLFKERGAKIATAIIGVVLIYTTLAGGALNYILRWIGVQW